MKDWLWISPGLPLPNHLPSFSLGSEVVHGGLQDVQSLPLSPSLQISHLPALQERGENPTQGKPVLDTQSSTLGATHCCMASKVRLPNFWEVHATVCQAYNLHFLNHACHLTIHPSISAPTVHESLCFTLPPSPLPHSLRRTA